MTFFLPPQKEKLPLWRFRLLRPDDGEFRICMPDNVWMRGDVKAGTLLKWDNVTKDGMAMMPAEEGEAIAVAVEPYPLMDMLRENRFLALCEGCRALAGCREECTKGHGPRKCAACGEPMTGGCSSLP